MVDSFYFLCIDEIYSPTLTQLIKLKRDEIFLHPNHWHFGLGGIILSASSLADLNMSMRRIQKKYYPSKSSPVFHYNDILNSKDLFSDLGIDLRKRQSFTGSLEYWITSSDFHYLASFIDSHELVKKYGIFSKEQQLKDIKKIPGNIYTKTTAKDYNLYSLALKFIMKEFYTFLSRKKYNARGVIITEARGEKEDIELREAFYSLQCNSIGSISARSLRQTIVDLLIVYKKQNHAGLQLADLLLYPTYDAAVANHKIRNDHFIPYDRIIKNKLLSRNSISVFPK